jgi:GxxExxY protein
MYNDRNRGRDDRSSYGGGRGGYGGGGQGGGGQRGGRGRGDGRGDRDGGGSGVPLSDPALTEVSRKVIGAAIEVHKALGPGFDKSVYAEALKVELEAAGVRYRADHAVPVNYKDRQVGTRTADLLIDERFVVELMSQRGEIGGAERAGLRALLRVLDMELGLIINFAERRLKDGLVRVLNPDKLNAMRAGAGGEAGEDDYHDDGGGEHADEGRDGPSAAEPGVYDPDLGKAS